VAVATQLTIPACSGGRTQGRVDYSLSLPSVVSGHFLLVVLCIRRFDALVNYMYRCLESGTLPVPSSFLLHQSLERNTALYYRMVPPLARSRGQLIFDTLRNDGQLTVSEIAHATECSRKAVWPATIP
jgi:hypothetical protein